MSDNETRDQLAAQLSAHLYDRGERVADWPDDERELHRDLDAWTSFTDRAEKVQALRYRKAADELLAAGWRPPARVVETIEELDALRIGSVVLVHAPGNSTPWQVLDFLGSKGGRLWTAPFLRARYTGAELFKRSKRLTVLHEPEEGEG